MEGYTTKEAAVKLNLKPLTVTRHITAGHITATMRSGNYFITQEEIDRFNRERPGPGRPKAGRVQS